MTSKEELLRLKKKYESYLRSAAGKQFVGVDLNSSIIVYVKDLTPQLAQFLPRTLEGVPVKIIETGPVVPLSLMRVPVAQAIFADRTGRFRPVPSGVSVAHPEITAGTFSCKAIDTETEEILGLSNNHVISPHWPELQVVQVDDPTLQPGPADKGTLDDQVGEVDRWIPVLKDVPNLVDVGAFRSEQLSEQVLEVGKPDALIEAFPGEHVLKSGRSSGITYSRILGCNATIEVEGWGTCIFDDQIVVSPGFMIPGDSGSIVLDADTHRVVGIGFAGSTEISVVMKASNVERLLGVKILAEEVGYMKWYTMLGLWAGVLAIGQLSLEALRTGWRPAGIVM